MTSFLSSLLNQMIRPVGFMVTIRTGSGHKIRHIVRKYA